MPEVLELTIDSLAYRGPGVGRHEGMVVFVPLTAPGDRVRVRVHERRDGYLRAELLEVLEPSPVRVAPPCPLFGVCGGCDWQHVAYPAQLEAKQAVVRDNLRRIGRIEAEVRPVVASPAYRYRNRVRLHVKDGAVGYFGRGSHRLVPVESCLLLDPRLEAALPLARGAGEGDVELRLTPDGGVSVGGGAFGQVNTAVNRELLGALRGAVSQPAPRSPAILDLYCGDGNLSIPLAGGGLIEGYDISASAVRRARARAAEEGLAGAVFRRGAVTPAFLSRLRGRGFDLLILDPPRKGLEGLAHPVAALDVPLVAYVSCSPPALARDLRSFTERGYVPELIQPLDMFPQTFHVETLAVLARRS